jgi:hypothetical protein
MCVEETIDVIGISKRSTVYQKVVELLLISPSLLIFPTEAIDEIEKNVCNHAQAIERGVISQVRKER